jgi:hypothetical protein
MGFHMQNSRHMSKNHLFGQKQSLHYKKFIRQAGLKVRKHSCRVHTKNIGFLNDNCLKEGKAKPFDTSFKRRQRCRALKRSGSCYLKNRTM